MMRDREQRIDELFAQAVELPPADWEKFLAEREAEDVAAGSGVLDRVRALLTNYRQAESEEFLNQPFKSADRAQTLKAGQEFEGYRILQLIAEGGMGEVYLAEDEALKRKLAIKLIKGHATKDILRRFQTERRILANLQHPNIAQLYEAGATDDGLPFFAMEYVEGQSIDQFIRDQELSLNDRLQLFRTVCSAVSYAHQKLVIHRDLKPGNVFVSKTGEVKLLDFGIAKLLQEGEVEPADATASQFRALTPQYASPEQVKGEPITTASDVYSLGVLLYELLTGRRPYKLKRQTADEITRAICEQEPTKPSSVRTDAEIGGHGDTETNQISASARLRVPASALRGDLDNIILKALRKEPERRYLSVEQFSEDIRRHLEGMPVTASADTFRYRTTKFVKRHKFGMTAAAVVLIVLCAGIITTSLAARRARLQSARAEQRFNQVRQLAHSVLFDYHDAIASLPGSTPVRERLVKDALKYLDELSGDPSNSPALQRELANAYLRVGDVQGRPYASNLGHTDDALASYHKALKILETMSAKSTADRDLKQGLATIYERIGNIQLRKGDFDEAFDRNSQALTMRTELVAADPNNKSYRHEMAHSLLYVGDALQVKCTELKCEQEALADQQRALQLRQEFAAEDPLDADAKRGVAQAHIRIGFRLSNLSHLTKEPDYARQWLEHDRAALAITRELVAANRTNAIDRRNLADELMATANAQLENKDTAGALSGYNESLESFKALAAADTSNSEAQRDLSFVYIRLGDLSAQTGKAASAREHYGRASEITQQLLTQDPSDEEGLVIVAAVYIGLDKLADDSGDLETAIENRKREIEVRGKIVAADPNTLVHWCTLAASYQRLAVLYAQKGGAHVADNRFDMTAPKVITARQAAQWREAKNYYEKALQIYEDLKSKGKLAADYAAPLDGVRHYMTICDSLLARFPRGQ